ncbi:glycosyltransferase [Croceicoccus sp. F390]|uniref:Glycosyltransferase n=1 Tax=Croceicoccus esteveae TaxID=3075597 RepID=A0ABU2ZJT3_9SPHN|nr:glycosyltransferase [Croceicoccus sp. F390]MDT0576865.1 glycosyltransferase [Croceicoccus sp. F390]
MIAIEESPRQAAAHPSADTPQVSILMAVHNGEAHLDEAMHSLLAQDFTDFEFVIVDDASGPVVHAMLEQHAAQDPRIVLVRNDRQLRLAASLNIGLQRCRAPLTARADADDIYAPERLSRQVAFLNKHPDVGVVSCGFNRIAQDGTYIATINAVTDPDQIAFDRLFINRILHPGVMFRTALVREAGGYDEAFWTAQDTELWARLAHVTRLANIREALVDYRVHDQSVSRSRGEEGQALSLSVPIAQIGRYLGTPLPQDEARAAIALYRSAPPLAAHEVLLAEKCLARIRRVAVQRETPTVMAHFERRISDSLFGAASRLKGSDPAAALLVAASAAAWRFNRRWAVRVARRLLARRLLVRTNARTA